MLKQVPTEDFDKVYQILADSFPANERRPYALQRALLEKREYRVLGCYEEQTGALTAFFAVYELGAVLFVEHFAVGAAYRNRGLGSEMLRELIAGTEKPVCLEVELPETALARRRIAFYRRNGFFYNDFYYIQPVLAAGQSPVELRLMTTGGEIDRSTFEGIRALLYAKVYHCEQNACSDKEGAPLCL